ncbi:MAG: methyltransferase domain-containing protein [Rhodoferax sp.]|nr:methyltransferase domain-containing protein [Rhodoferax sp.]
MTVVDRALLNHGFPGRTWGNLGLWTEAQDYPAACEALAVKLADSAQLQPGCSVLDVGFGYGDQLLLWKKRFGIGRITGMETDAAGVAEARLKLTAFTDVSLHHSNGDLLPTEERYDRVLALDCAYHFAPRSAFFAHAFQTLHPGGLLALTDIVVADGVSSAQHAGLAKVCGIPRENLLTQTAYRQALIDLGFSHVTFETLDEEVLSGFSRFAMCLLRRRTFAALSAGGLKVLATAAIIRWLLLGQRAHYVLVTAERPT